MNNTIILKSSFARVINEYLRIRQSQGVNIAHELTIMKELDQIMVRHGKPVEQITRELIEEWQSMQFNESDRTKYAKACQMIRFCTYLCHIGIDSYIMPKPKRPANFCTKNLLQRRNCKNFQHCRCYNSTKTHVQQLPYINACFDSFSVLRRLSSRRDNLD